MIALSNLPSFPSGSTAAGCILSFTSAWQSPLQEDQYFAHLVKS